MRRLFICSPYAGTAEAVRYNLSVAEEVCRIAMWRGYAPFAPHLIYTRFLNEDDDRQRAAGIAAGLEFMPVCEEVWAIVHVGNGELVTEGMRLEVGKARALGIPVRWFRFVNGGLIDVCPEAG